MNYILKAAKKFGLTPKQYMERDQNLKKQEDEMKKRVLDPNSKVTEEEKLRALNATESRRFMEPRFGYKYGKNYNAI